MCTIDNWSCTINQKLLKSTSNYGIDFPISYTEQQMQTLNFMGGDNSLNGCKRQVIDLKPQKPVLDCHVRNVIPKF